MALTVSVAATNRQLTTVEAVKAELGIETEIESDYIIDVLIDEASALIETYCNRVFARQTYIETVKGNDQTFLMLSATPIVSVSSISSGGSPVTGYTIENDKAGELYLQSGWGWQTASIGWLARTPRPGAENPNYSVTYVAGFKLPADANRDLPYEIERACKQIVKSWYLNRQNDPAIKDMSVSDLRVSLNQSETGIPIEMMGYLSNWVKSL